MLDDPGGPFSLSLPHSPISRTHFILIQLEEGKIPYFLAGYVQRVGPRSAPSDQT